MEVTEMLSVQFCGDLEIWAWWIFQVLVAIAVTEPIKGLFPLP